MPKYLDQFGDGVRQVIRAYHGSPYDFDRFDASKIGTGEGAAAYGHGFYASQAEPVADWYRRELSGPPDIFIGGELATKGSRLSSASPRERALYLLDRAALRYPAPMEALREAVLDAGDQFGGREVRPIIDSLMRFKSDGVTFGPRKGKTYELEIGYPEEALLDYDRPFSTPAGVAGAEVLRQQNPAALSARALRAIEDGSWRMESFAGRSPYETAAVELTRLAQTRGGAQSLSEAGIPGIRYLDYTSRAAGEGTRNYVIFPGAEDQIRILRKYGLLAPIPAAAAMRGEE